MSVSEAPDTEALALPDLSDDEHRLLLRVERQCRPREGQGEGLNEATTAEFLEFITRRRAVTDEVARAHAPAYLRERFETAPLPAPLERAVEAASRALDALRPEPHNFTGGDRVIVVAMMSDYLGEKGTVARIERGVDSVVFVMLDKYRDTDVPVWFSPDELCVIHDQPPAEPEPRQIPPTPSDGGDQEQAGFW